MIIDVMFSGNFSHACDRRDDSDRAEPLPQLPRAMRRDLQHEPFELVGYECAEERGAFTNSLCAFLQIYNDTHQ
jgi:hypothetical protein